MISLDDIQQAERATRPYVRKTPLEASPAMEEATGARTWLKLENLQVTGSFKPRGPFNRLQAMTEAERKAGVVAATAGNHGVGLSYAGMLLGVPVHIHIAKTADKDKLKLLHRHGAMLHFAESYDEAHFNSIDMASTLGLLRVSPYNDPWVVASDGVVGLEILEKQPDVDLVIVPVGGGGLLAGISLAIKSGNPKAEVWGVEAAVSPTFNTWFREKRVVPVKTADSIGEGLSGYVEPDVITWPIIRDRVTRMIAVSDAELVSAMRWMVTEHRMIVEPSGAAAVAAALRAGRDLEGRRVVAVVSGGNVAWSRFLQLVENRA
jgi:threonine dehydratase